eukprot:684003-Rhodomonas_salina.1
MLSGNGLSDPTCGTTKETPVTGPDGYGIGCSGVGVFLALAPASCTTTDGRSALRLSVSKTHSDAMPILEHRPPANTHVQTRALVSERATPRRCYLDRGKEAHDAAE